MNLAYRVPEFRSPLKPGLTLWDLNSKRPWFVVMIADYRKFFTYVVRGDIPNANVELKKGLNINSGLNFFGEGKITVLQVLGSNQRHGNNMYVWLVQNGAIHFKQNY